MSTTWVIWHTRLSPQQRVSSITLRASVYLTPNRRAPHRCRPNRAVTFWSASGPSIKQRFVVCDKSLCSFLRCRKFHRGSTRLARTTSRQRPLQFSMDGTNIHRAAEDHCDQYTVLNDATQRCEDCEHNNFASRKPASFVSRRGLQQRQQTKHLLQEVASPTYCQECACHGGARIHVWRRTGAQHLASRSGCQCEFENTPPCARPVTGYSPERWNVHQPQRPI